MSLKKVRRFAVLTLVLLPASCVPGYFAMGRLALRTDGHFAYNEPQWIESLLWIAALLLILFWAWAGDKILKEND